jgi:uncharacterized protein YejL (UPF0352 family)
VSAFAGVEVVGVVLIDEMAAVVDKHMVMTSCSVQLHGRLVTMLLPRTRRSRRAM